MRLEQAANPHFARHETFHPRYGWFRKAFIFIDEDENIFNDENATVRIGVGKNMVRSIRFWGLASKLIEEVKEHSRRYRLTTTEVGNNLFGPSGWDQYMEMPGTLWLIHWHLLSPLSRLPVWWLAFNEFNAIEFTDEDLENFIIRHLTQNSEWNCPSVSTVKKDVSTLLRSYCVANKAIYTGLEEALDSPLRELKLIGFSHDGMKYRFAFDEKPTLPPEVLVYALLDFVSSSKNSASTANISRLANESGAPGKAFKLTEFQIIEKIETVIKRYPNIKLASTAGATQLTWSGDPKQISYVVINDYYCSMN